MYLIPLFKTLFVLFEQYFAAEDPTRQRQLKTQILMVKVRNLERTANGVKIIQ
jgi:hypothetical protein